MCQICNNKVLLIETPPPHLNGVDYVNWYTPNQIRPITNDCKDCCATTYYYFAMVVYKTSSLHIYPISESIHWPRPTAGLLRTAVLTGRQKTWKLKPVRTYPLHRNLCHTQTHTKKERGKNDLLLLRRSRSNSTKIYAHSHCYYYEPTGRRKIIKKKNMRSVSKWKRIKQNGTQKGSTELLVKVYRSFSIRYIQYNLKGGLGYTHTQVGREWKEEEEKCVCWARNFVGNGT